MQSSRIEDSLPGADSVGHDGGEMMEFIQDYFRVEDGKLDEGCEDGLTLSRRSVLTEKLLPPRWTPEGGKRARRELEGRQTSVVVLPV